VELYLHSPITPSWRGAQLKKKHRDSCTFTFSSWTNGSLHHSGFKFQTVAVSLLWEALVQISSCYWSIWPRHLITVSASKIYCICSSHFYTMGIERITVNSQTGHNLYTQPSNSQPTCLTDLLPD
jgi:hypothetical protein